MALGKNIKFHRERLGLTLLQLSDASGVDVGTISALEVRDSRRSQYGSAIAAAMGMTFEQLAGSDLPQDQPPPLAPAKADSVSSIGGPKLPALDSNEEKLLTAYRRSDAATQVLIDLALTHPDTPMPDGLSPSLRTIVAMARAAIASDLDQHGNS
jgi:hypothetical protein